jgi:hypothetical protein
MPEYYPPVSSLLTRGEADPESWDDYLPLGFRPEHVPDLIQIATDVALLEAPSDSPEVWAPLHAWRTLGQMEAVEAVRPLLDLIEFEARKRADWGLEELLDVIAMIGAPAIPVLAEYLADRSKTGHLRNQITDTLVRLAEQDPDHRDECVAVLTRQLEHASENPRELNGFLVGCLMDLNAVESAPVMEKAFAAGVVDKSIAGDWATVAYELGLTDTPPPEPKFFPLSLEQGGFRLAPEPSTKKAKQKTKAKRKQAAKARKRNRKRR